MKAIKIVFTNIRLNSKDISNLKPYVFNVDDDSIEVGAMLVPNDYKTNMLVIAVHQRLIRDDSVKLLRIKSIYHNSVPPNISEEIIEEIIEETSNLQIKENKIMAPSKNNMFGSIVEKYKSQYMPVKVEGLRLSMDGNICVPINDEYVGITANDELVSFPEGMTFSIPVYMISKPSSQLKVGDIVKHSTHSYSKVLGRTLTGKLKLLSHSGNSVYRADIKDFLTGQALVPTIVNMFSSITTGSSDTNNPSGMNLNGMNPLMMMAMSDGEMDYKSIMMMQMMMGGQMNPMMMMAMMGGDDKNSPSSSMESLFMMQAFGGMMGGQNPMGSMFNTPVFPAVESSHIKKSPIKKSRKSIVKKSKK